ncbi:MAG: hypothetical protein ACP5LE_06380 [Thermoplasmata archaeon]
MWKEKFKEFIKWKDESGNYIVEIEYLLGIARGYPNLIPKKEPKDGSSKERWDIYQQILKENDKNAQRDKFVSFLECIVDESIQKGLSSFTWPTVIVAPNLWLDGENAPSKEDIWHVIYLTYSSVKFGNYLINLDYVSDAGRRWFWQTMVTSRVIAKEKSDISPLRENLKVDARTSEPMYCSLCLLGFLFRKIEEDEKQKEEKEMATWQKLLHQRYLSRLGWSDQTTLILFGREQKGIFYSFPRVIEIVKWLDPSIKLIEFLNSLVLVVKDEREVAGKEREKLVFYLFKYNHIYGELLEKLVTMKCNYELKKKGKIYGISGAKNFFSNL